MAYSYTSRNGQRVEVAVAAAFDRLNAAFKARFGLSLLVSSGTRTRAEQQHLYNLYKAGKGNLAAAPGYSNHEESGPRGPRALDVRDSGSDAGVTTRGTTRANWLRANAPAYGFNPAGYGFSQIEPWHIEFTGTLGSAGGGGSAGNATVANQQNWLRQSRGETIAADGIYGPATKAAFARYQTFLRSYGYTGAIDGEWGAGTQAAHEKYYAAWHGSSGALAVDGKLGPATIKLLQSRLGITQDGEWGPATTTALQKWLGVTADGEIGPATVSALQKAVGAAVDGQLGPATITALQRSLNAGGFQPHATTPPTTTPPADTKLTVDGQWGEATTRAFQTRLGVTVDGEMGPLTWKAFQKATGQNQDGEVGPMTVKALQMNVGAGVDGAIGPETIKKLQEFLNAGTAFKVVKVETTPTEPTVTYPKPVAPEYPDADWWDHSPNSSPRRAGDKVQYFVVHHAAATSSVDALRTRFMNANDRKVSPNWLIGKDGSVSEIVPPDKFRAWTSGQFDYNAVTVETQNTSGDPTWGISEESHIAIAKLVAWASKRYGFPIDRTHVIGHREVPGAATACPGPSMSLDRIVDLAKTFVDDNEVPGEPEVPIPPKDEWTITLSKSDAAALGDLLDKLRDLLP